MCLVIVGACTVSSAAFGQTGGADRLSPQAVLDRVFTSVQTAQASAAGQALAEAGARVVAGNRDLAQRLRDRQDLTAAVGLLEERLSAAAIGRDVSAEDATRAIEAELLAATTQLADLDALIDREFPDYKELTDPAPLDIAALQGLLDADEALVMTLIGDQQTYVWAVSPTDAAWHRAEIGREAITSSVQRLRADLGGSGAVRGAEALEEADAPRGRSFDRATAYQLYSDLLAPVDGVISGAAHVMVVVDGPLTSLPFGLLVTEPPEGRDDDPDALRGTAWMIKRQAVTTLPAVAGLRTLRRPFDARDGGAPGFVGFGDPLLGYRARQNDLPQTGELMAAADTSADQGVVTRGVYDDIRRVADLAPLPNTARELRALARTLEGATGGAGWQTRLFLGDEAREAQVKAADLSQATILAFATHGLLTGGVPGLTEPALVFTPPEQPSERDDALLTASEASQLRLAADLIILSACDTAGGDGRPGAEGLSGLARAFIYAGARAILVSHWPVDDYAASQLTVRMLAGMYGPQRLRRAEALRQSMLSLMAEPESRFAHPAIWAPFVVVGEGGADRILP
jgi:CHAT domain-containing protein